MKTDLQKTILAYLNNEITEDEKTRTYEKKIADYADKNSSEEGIKAFEAIMQGKTPAAYKAFFCLATILRHNRDYTDLKKLITEAENREDFKNHISLSHIRIAYEVHSESLYDYDALLEEAHKSACDLIDNSGYLQTFANAFATICEKCLPEDLDSIVRKWYDSALYCVNKAIELDPKYAKFYCTKARIVSVKNHFEEANDLILKAIDLESSKKRDYALLIGNYQYHRVMINLRKQQWMMESRMGNAEPVKISRKTSFRESKPYAFISYAHKDSEKVFRILDDLTDAGYNYWCDQEIKGGDYWPEEIGRRLMDSDLVVVMLSNSSILSRNVRNEITMAQNLGKKIVPVFIEKVVLSPGAKLQLESYNFRFEYKMSAESFHREFFDDLSKVRITSDKIAVNEAKEDSKAEENINGLPGIIEKLCVSKTGKAADCEDRLVIRKDQEIIAVIDGATSKERKVYKDNRTGGRIAADVIYDFLTDKNFDPSIDYRTAVNLIQSRLKDCSEKLHLEESGIHLCASAVIYSATKRQIWTIGDCQFMLNGELHTFHKKVDSILAETRALAIHMLMLAGEDEKSLMNDDKGRKMILEGLKMQQYLENSSDEYGYSVLSSRGDVKDIVVTDVPPGSEIVLASDGYPELFDTLSRSEERLKEIIDSDPLCYKYYKSTKGLVKGCKFFDDRSYIRFRI